MHQYTNTQKFALKEFVEWIIYESWLRPFRKVVPEPILVVSECNKKHTCMLLLPLEAFYLVCALESIDYSNCKNMNALR